MHMPVHIHCVHMQMDDLLCEAERIMKSALSTAVEYEMLAAYDADRWYASTCTVCVQLLYMYVIVDWKVIR